MDDQLDVFINEHKAGRLWLDGMGRMCFQYTDDWLNLPEAHSLSISLPLQDAPYLNDSCYPYFTNLLPGSRILTVLARKLEIPVNDKFNLLKAIGGDCAGAVSLYPEGKYPPDPEDYQYEFLSEDHLLGKINDLKQNPLLAKEEKRLSLAGAVDKLPILIKDGKILLPINGSPTTHILKMPVENLLGIVTNETYCMTLARNMGMDVPDVDMIKIGDLNIYVIERYDRVIKNGRVLRLIQEDFCQAQNKNSEFKYRFSFHQYFDLIREHSSSPIEDSRKLLRAIIFNGLIGNSDGHAKNISFLHTENGTRLTPFYDLVCTQIEGYNFSTRMPAKLAGKKRDFRHLEKRHFEAFAREIGMKPSIVYDTVIDMSEKIIQIADQTADDFKSQHGSVHIVDEINNLIHNHVVLIAKTFVPDSNHAPNGKVDIFQSPET